MTEAPRAPSPLLLLLEARAFAELGAYFASLPLHRLAQAGDGHPVLVLPGLGASDLSTRPLRAFLRRLGYQVHAWKLGRNVGDPDFIVPLQQRLAELHGRHRQPVSLIGWSLGGLFARELARRAPDAVRQVITLGSPFAAGTADVSNARRLYRWLSGREPGADRELQVRLCEPLPVPTSCIYSRSDGIVAWQCCIEAEHPRAENIEVYSSHSGMGVHPQVLFVIAERLAQPTGQWRPYRSRRS